MLVLIAGCGAAPTSTPTGVPPATPTDTQSATSMVTPTATAEDTETQITTVQTPTPTCEPNRLTAELKIQLHTELPVRITITERGTNRLVLNETYSESTEKVVYGENAGVFEPATDYQVHIRANDTVRWNRTVRNNQEYQLIVEDNGNVRLPQGPVIVNSATPSC